MTAPLTPRAPQAPRLDGGDAGLTRRHARDRAMTVLLATVMAITLAVLAWVLVYVAAQGLKYLGPAFFTQTPPGNPAQVGGGYANGIIGSLIIVGIATVISVPVGIAAAIAIIEYPGRLGAATSFVTLDERESYQYGYETYYQPPKDRRGCRYEEALF